MELTRENIWVRELEQGKEQAYQKLFDFFYAALCTFANRYVGASGAAEDIVQDTFYDLWLKKLHFENERALKSYLYTAVRSRCLDFLKHQKVKDRYLSEQVYKEKSDFFLETMLEEEVYFMLKKALASLQGQTRQVYELIFSGATNTDVAEKMGITLDAVKAHKKRGKKLIQERLKGYICFFCFFRRNLFIKKDQNL